eukprot:TRINITY_DN5910_c0_g1_i2.p1 TRINITY_DN5910_c0_g1~~TRINITY_DN5910_c0_g1_i2.p1  ORF type:complete len:307 (+),score=22.67 TRINITY_DN5910_c0_g1_i2:93-1013(+)
MDQRTYGLFSYQHGHHGSAYTAPHTTLAKPGFRVGKQMLGAPPKQGQQDRGITPFVRLELDRYLEPEIRLRREKMAAKGLQVSPGDFKYANPGKKNTGPGTYEGTLGDAHKHHPDRHIDGTQTTRSAPQPARFSTNWPKKGKAGYADRGIGSSTARWMPDPYQAGERERRARVLGHWSGFRQRSTSHDVVRQGNPNFKATRTSAQLIDPHVERRDASYVPGERSYGRYKIERPFNAASGRRDCFSASVHYLDNYGQQEFERTRTTLGVHTGHRTQAHPRYGQFIPTEPAHTTRHQTVEFYLKKKNL